MSHVKSNYNTTPTENLYERRTGQTLTPLLHGMIQIHKMKKGENIEAVRNELIARGLGTQFDEKTNWTKLLGLLKTHEGNNKYFCPVTPYNNFMWLSFYYE